jgi:hypothetical protein
MPLFEIGPAPKTKDENLYEIGPAEETPRESSITQVGVLDTNTLMADDFDMEKHIGPEKSAQLDLIGDKNETLSDLKISAFLQNMGVQQENINAADIMLKAQADEKSSGVWDSIKEGWNNGRIDSQSGDIGLAWVNGQITDAQALAQDAELDKRRVNTKAESWVGDWFKAGVGILPVQIDTSSEGAKYAIGAGAAAAALTAAAQTGTVVTAPTMPVTVPISTLTVGGVGFKYGSIKRMVEIETGSAAMSMLKMTDDQGNKLDPTIIRRVSNIVGALNGALEFVQLKTLINTIPGGKKLLARANQKAIKEILQNPSIWKILMKGGARYAGHVGTETGTEVLQKIDNIAGEILTKHLTNEMDGTNFKTDIKKDIVGQLVNETIQSTKAFSLISLPGNVVQTGGEALSVKKPTTAPASGKTTVGAAQPVLPGTEPVGRISRVMASEKIIPRLDVDSLGKTLVDVPVELPPKKERQIATNSEPKALTPEEEYQVQQSEATLKAEEPFTITPELYIGNVTARMKEVVGEDIGVDPEQIQGFHEGAWPTKRTKITLKMDEARGLLVHMEESLQKRVDENQLNTDSDLARANADWGDIKELRRKLGLPKTLRPFKVIRETGPRIITIENTRERIQKTTKSGAQDVVKMTEMERLNNVMQRVAKAAKEGWAGGKKEAKQTFALLQYLRKQKQLRDKLVKNIRKDVNEKVNFFYREAIQGLQNAIDWNVKTEGKKQKKESLRDFLNRNPEHADEIPVKLIETLAKKDVNNLSYSDLLAMNEEINRLKQLGELKSETLRAERAKAIEKEATEMAELVNKAPVGIFQTTLEKFGYEKIAQVERALGLRPMRIFDMLDGGKDFAGRIYTFFYGHTNEDYNAELLNTEQRQEGMKRRQAELNISMAGLLQTRIVDKFTLTVDEMINVYMAWKNAKSRATLMDGGGEISSSKDYMLVDDALYNKVVEHLNENEMLWGDTIISEYGQNSYDRLRNTVIAAENRDMGKEENYSPILTVREEVVSAEQELLDEMALRHYFRQDGPHKGMTIPRKDIPAEFRRPMKLGATKIWFQSVRKQEHYINNALHIKDMQAILRKDEFRKAIVEKFGQPIFDTVTHFVKMIANPDYYKGYSDLETLSKLARRHVAIAYIAFRIPSMLNQIPAIMSYWANSSFGDILTSAMDSASHPMETYEKAKLAHPQISHRSIEREMEEMQIADNTAYERIVSKVGTAGMYGMFSIDRAIRVIGINAVYNKAIRDGLSPKEAADKAAKTTLLTQEASTPKDLAKLYSSSEWINWFTMFTNQLNQIYNITTYDIPTQWRNKNYREASRSAISLATMSMMIWMIQNKDIPDEPEDALQAVGEQFVASIPLFGSYLLSGMKGWNASAPAPLEQVAKMGMAISKIPDDPEKALEKMLEPLSIMAGVPYQMAKEAYQFIEEVE